MEEYFGPRPLDALLIALRERGWDCIADEASDRMIVIDNAGDYHECWNGGDADTVNVCVAMTISEAVEYFMNPRQVDELKDKNERLRKMLSSVLIISGGFNGRQYLASYLREEEGIDLWQELRYLGIVGSNDEHD